MKLFYLLILPIFLGDCSFSSSAYEREMEKCEKRTLELRLFQIGILNSNLDDPNLSQDEKESVVLGTLMSDILLNQLKTCKDRVKSQNYVNGPLP